MKKLFIVLMISTIFATIAQAQNRLRLTKLKSTTFNKYASKWNSWPSVWSYFKEDQGPIIQSTGLDDRGVTFKIDTWISGKHSTFYVSYKRYDSKNGWYEYVDESGDEINVKGATLSYLSENGWPPGEKVQIYFWLFSEDMALVME